MWCESITKILFNSVLNKIEEFWVIVYILLPLGAFEVLRDVEHVVVEVNAESARGRDQYEHGHVQF